MLDTGLALATSCPERGRIPPLGTTVSSSRAGPRATEGYQVTEDPLYQPVLTMLASQTMGTPDEPSRMLGGIALGPQAAE